MFEEITAAMNFAAEAHKNQRRKYSGEPYINHAIRVAHTVSMHIEESYSSLIAAALCHDTIEDCNVTRDELSKIIGPTPAWLVWQVTNPSQVTEWNETNPKPNRATRKKMDKEHLANATAWGKMIKLADILDNTSDIAANDPDFGRVYIVEKLELLPVLVDSHQALWHLTDLKLRELYRTLHGKDFTKV